MAANRLADDAGVAAAPLLAVAVAIGGAAYLIYRNWDVVAPFLASVWETIKAGAMVAWNVLRFAFSWSPLGIIVNNWGAVTAWAGAFWENLSAVATAGVAVITGVLPAWNPLQLVRAAWEPVIGFLSGGTTMGQWLSLPMVLAGIYFIWRAKPITPAVPS